MEQDCTQIYQGGGNKQNDSLRHCEVRIHFIISKLFLKMRTPNITDALKKNVMLLTPVRSIITEVRLYPMKTQMIVLNKNFVSIS